MDQITTQAVQELAQIQAQQAGLKEREDALKTHLRALEPGTYYDAHGAPMLRIVVPQIFDADSAAATLSQRDRKRCEKVTYDSKRVRALTDDISLYESSGTARVSVLDGALHSASVTTLEARTG
ncbi:MAG: hypothetical protein ACRDQA_01830 [Nocardioidaceae bacterium]